MGRTKQIIAVRDVEAFITKLTLREILGTASTVRPCDLRPYRKLIAEKARVGDADVRRAVIEVAQEKFPEKVGARPDNVEARPDNVEAPAALLHEGPTARFDYGAEAAALPPPDDIDDAGVYRLIESRMAELNGVYIILVGSPGTGKSSVQRLLLAIGREGELWDTALYISPSASGVDSLAPVLPRRTLFSSEWKPALVTELLATQRALLKEGHEVNAVAVLDDVVGGKVKCADALLQGFARGRHCRTSFILAAQSATLCSPEWRNCTHFIITTHLANQRQRLHIIEQYLMDSVEYEGSKASQVRAWHTWLKNATKDFHAVIIDLATYATYRIVVPKLEQKVPRCELPEDSSDDSSESTESGASSSEYVSAAEGK